MNEVIAERKVECNAKAYSNIKELQAAFGQSTLEDAMGFMLKNEDWFFENRLFLPGKFPELWMEIRTDLRKLKRRQENNTPSDEVIELDESISNKIDKAIKEIYTDMEMEPSPTHNKL
jgi:hypothetical protein